MDKFGRNYVLRVEKQDGGILTISLPFTIEFDITRSTLSSANVCQIRIYNLSLENRNQIRVNAIDYTDFKSIELRAGYGDNLPVIFTGNITQAWSVREGVDFITQIECYDGGFAFVNGVTDAQFPAGTPFKAVVGALAGSLPETKLGTIGNYPGVLTRENSYTGNTMKVLTEITGGGVFIDNGKVNALLDNEYIATVADGLVISSASGLLGTPILERTTVRFGMIFEPQLNAGYKITLDSLTESNFNGEYKVVGVKHRGMISESVAGTVVTSGEYFYSKILQGVFGL